MHTESKPRLIRRIAGNITARLAELPLGSVADPRKRRVKLKMRAALAAVVAAMAAGCKSLGELEHITDWMTGAIRRRLRIPGRIPDTTLRDLLVAIDPNQIRILIRRAIKCAWRRKQLRQDFPLRVVSMDGKATSTRLFDRPTAPVKYAQVQGNHAVVRTITSCYVSTPSRPCLDAHPVPPKTNEMGAFADALDALLAAYRWLRLQVVMYDSGACSLTNANTVVARGLDYVFCLTQGQPTLLDEARRLLGRMAPSACVAETFDLDGSHIVTRRLFLSDRMAGYLDWHHLGTVLRIHTLWQDKVTGETRTENRYYLTSLRADRLTPDQWMVLIRRRWAVENENHNTFDTVLGEDQRPWILDPQGMLVVMLLRRLTYDLLTLFRSVTLRSAANRSKPWRRLLDEIRMTLLLASEEAMAGLRRRCVIAD